MSLVTGKRIHIYQWGVRILHNVLNRIGMISRAEGQPIVADFSKYEWNPGMKTYLPRDYR